MDDVRGDFLGPPHGTTPAAVIANKIKTEIQKLIKSGYIGFSMKKKTVEILKFSGSIVACDLKVGRYRQHVELLKLCEYSRSKSFLDLGQMSFTY